MQKRTPPNLIASKRPLERSLPCSLKLKGRANRGLFLAHCGVEIIHAGTNGPRNGPFLVDRIAAYVNTNTCWNRPGSACLAVHRSGDQGGEQLQSKTRKGNTLIFYRKPTSHRPIGPIGSR